MSLVNKSVLVTGGAGFIGSHLIDRLVKEKPANLVAVDNFYLGKEANLRDAKRNFPALKVINADASNQIGMEHLVKKEGVDVIFNLAVIPLPMSLIDPCWVYRHNVDITLCVCELARKGYYKTLIHCSSSEVYGDCEYAPMDERHPLNPTTAYSASKAATDHLVLSYCKSLGIDAAIIRPFNNYGSRQNKENYAGVIPLTIKRILNGEVPIVYGDGEQTRDYIHVADTAEAAIKVYDCPDTRGKVINIASGQEIKIKELIGLVAEYMGYDKPLSYEQARAGDLRRLVGGVALAKKILQFAPTIGFDSGLKTTVEWYKKETRN
jgi:UDP-glucose 4-epimerase